MENQSTLETSLFKSIALGRRLRPLPNCYPVHTGTCLPALASIQAAFPNVDTTIIQQIIALPTMLMVFFNVLRSLNRNNWLPEDFLHRNSP